MESGFQIRLVKTRYDLVLVVWFALGVDILTMLITSAV